MAVTSDPYTATDLAAMIKEVWTPIVLEELFAKVVAANFFTDLSPYMSEGGDIAHVPDVYTNSFTVRTQATQGAEVTTESVAQQDVTLTIDTHRYIAYIIGDQDLKFLGTSYDYNSIYARKAGRSIADALEDAIFALWSGLSTTVGSTANVLSDLDVRQSIRTLAALNFDVRELAWFMHPLVWWDQVVAIQKFYDSSMAGRNGSFTLNGNFGEMDLNRGLSGHLYGVPVYTSTNVVSNLLSYRNILAHPTAFGFAVNTKGGSRIRVQAENAIRNLGMLTVLDLSYGVTELRDGAGVVADADTGGSTA